MWPYKYDLNKLVVSAEPKLLASVHIRTQHHCLALNLPEVKLDKTGFYNLETSCDVRSHFFAIVIYTVFLQLMVFFVPVIGSCKILDLFLKYDLLEICFVFV